MRILRSPEGTIFSCGVLLILHRDWDNLTRNAGQDGSMLHNQVMPAHIIFATLHIVLGSVSRGLIWKYTSTETAQPYQLDILALQLEPEPVVPTVLFCDAHFRMFVS